MANPSFATERLSLDVAAVTDVVGRTFRGISTTETSDGIKLRTSDGMLIAYLAGTGDEESPVELHYRTAPASDAATLNTTRATAGVVHGSARRSSFTPPVRLAEFRIAPLPTSERTS